MKPGIKVMLLSDQGEKFFGEGPYRLLKETEKTGSLRCAASNMGMAYSKAIRIISAAEENLGYKLTYRKIGGKGGGGSLLTEETKELLQKYEKYKAACNEAAEKIYCEIFEE